jgi:hypothetical protein
MAFQVKIIENLISKYHITEERQLGRPPKTVPPTMMNASHYPTYIAATVSKQNYTIGYKWPRIQTWLFIVLHCIAGLHSYT